VEDFGEEIEGCSADAVDGDVCGEELINVGAANVFRIGADERKALEIVGGEVGEGMGKGAKVVGGES